MSLRKSNKYNVTPEKNINLVYSELAKQLKKNKNEYEFSGNEKDSNFSGTREKDSVNQSAEQIYMANLKVTSRSNFNMNSLGNSKTTKENTCTMSGNLNNMNTRVTNLNINRVENPEELHLFYVSLVQKSKSLAFKFDNNF